MIIVGNKKIKIINPAHIVHLELSKGKVSAYAKGDTDGDVVTIVDFSVREPWTVVIRTTVGTHYINHPDFESALTCLVGICKVINQYLDVETFTNQMRRVYGKETKTQS